MEAVKWVGGVRTDGVSEIDELRGSVTEELSLSPSLKEKARRWNRISGRRYG